MKISTIYTALIVFALFFVSCGKKDHVQLKKEVTATAYNSTEEQTKKGNVGLAAWGDQLEPGMKAIAVSRDLIKEGLIHNREVTIEGLSGTYKVMDKMNKRWEDKIDIYMGLDEEQAREWGKRKVVISYEIPLKDTVKFNLTEAEMVE